MTAAIANYLIERTRSGRVNLCEDQGDQWIVIRRNITLATASAWGFNPDAPSVRRIFGL
jgi:hypothetical protein